MPLEADPNLYVICVAVIVYQRAIIAMGVRLKFQLKIEALKQSPRKDDGYMPVASRAPPLYESKAHFLTINNYQALIIKSSLSSFTKFISHSIMFST